MTPHRLIGAASLFAVVAAVSVLLAQTQTPVQTPQGAEPVFRTSTDLITVDVGVKNNGTPVADLKASDFVLLDNGVVQRIESIEMEQVPVDITLLVDTNVTLAANVDSFNNDLQKIRSFVRPNDQLRVMQMDTYVTDLLPLARAGSQPEIGRLKPGGLSSAHDGLAAALMRVNPSRPSLIVAITDSIDAVSALTSDAVLGVARLSSATLHISWVTMSEKITPLSRPGQDPAPPPFWESAHEMQVAFSCSTAGACQPTHRFWLPYYEAPGPIREKHDFGNLREATAVTGGAIHAPGIFAERDAAAVFKKVFEDYRRTYLLRYTPKGAPKEGWHEIVVKIPAHTGYTINARRGYAVDTSGSTGGTAAVSPRQPAPTGALRPATLADLTSAYGRADFAGAQAAFQRVTDRTKLIRDFRAGGNPWPSTPRREAALVLELADAVFQEHRDDARLAARDLLAWYNKLVRPTFEPDGFERDWLWAELAILQGTVRPQIAQGFVGSALERFPDEPRFVLAQAIITDQQWLTGSNTVGGGTSASQITSVTTQYDAAMAHPETAFEARVREAWFLHRIGLHARALELLDAAGDQSPDVMMLYLRHLFRGEVLDALGRLDDAIVAYRAAMALRPDAQSARVALMNAFVKKGDRDDARVLAEAVQAAPSGEPDPWWLYWQGDYRLYPVALTRVRAQGFLESGR
jgi:tetratricopeptide (TPR) repeat protein